MNPEEWLESQCIFTGDDKDHVSVRDLWYVYRLRIKSITYKEFSYYASGFLQKHLNNVPILYFKQKHMNSHTYHSILWKVKRIG
jgi:hypothetical protein